MAYYKLKEEHPVTQKVRKLEQLMDDMGLQITVGHNDQLIIRSDETNEYVCIRYVAFRNGFYTVLYPFFERWIK